MFSLLVFHSEPRTQNLKLRTQNSELPSDSALRTIYSVPTRDPAHHAAADRIAQGMFLVRVVQRIEGGEGHLSVTHIARLGLLLPELICDPDIKEVVAADTC